MTEHQNDSIAFILGCIAGLALGLGVGMLYAPREGRVTRRFVTYEAKRAKKKAVEVVDKAETAVGLKKKPDRYNEQEDIEISKSV